MKMSKSTIVVAAISLMAMLPIAASAETCKVTDPTGTRLNVRSSPNGKVISTLKNGTKIRRVDHADDSQGRSWVLAYTEKTNKRIGWVYREFVSCYQSAKPNKKTAICGLFVSVQFLMSNTCFKYAK